jgi:hypothetical protein
VKTGTVLKFGAPSLNIPSIGRLSPGIAKIFSETHLPPPLVPQLIVFPSRPHTADIDARFDALVATVEWGDGVDYGEDASTPTEEQREDAAAFLKSLARSMPGRVLPSPEISPTMNGDIDIHWRLPKGRELLLCMRGNSTASYFGKSATGPTIKGTVRTDENNAFLLVWLDS